MNADDYHNILSEEFPSPIRQDVTPLPVVQEEQVKDASEHQAEVIEGRQEDDANRSQQLPAHIIEDVIQTVPSPVSPPSAAFAQTPLDGIPIGSVTPEPTEEVEQDHRVSIHELDQVDEASPGPSNHGEAGPPPPPSNRKRRGHYKHLQLTAQERKDRQRAQNREAAQRSRNNKAKDLELMEAENIKTQEEVTALRARLAALQAARNGTAPNEPASGPVVSSPVPQGDLKVDSVYHGRLKQELRANREQLLIAESELKEHIGVDLSSLWTKRLLLLDRLTDLSYLQAETSALESVKASLEKEREDIKSQTESIEREVEARKSYMPPTTTSEELPSGADGREDRNLMDIGGWVDAAVRDWQESGDIETQHDMVVHANDEIQGDGMDVDAH